MAHAIVRNSPALLDSREAQGEAGKCRVALIGLADDLGVELNGGRIGAAQGPGAFRAALAKYGVAEPFGWEWPRVFDVGNIIPSPGNDEAALHETHRRVTAAVKAVLEMSDGRLFPIGIGGGHDLTYPFVRGVIEFWRGRGVEIAAGAYFDAHLDVRETVGSGMPFRRLIEACGVKRLALFGLDEQANSREHRKWFGEHGGSIGDEWWADAPMFVSADLDVLDAAYAPGVSALNPCGWGTERLGEMCERAGGSEHVRCFDIMELNPAHDHEGRTARVAAWVFLRFMKGFAARAGG